MVRRVKKKVVSFDKKYFPVWQALDSVINAWEELPGGKNYSASEVAAWLLNHVSPAIDHARKVMGRSKPDGRT